MDFREITPLITVFGPAAILVALLDYALRQDRKEKMSGFLLSVANLCTRPLSVRFYGFTVAASVIFNVLILTLNGLVERLTNPHGLYSTWLESSAPILLAIMFKMLLWDYVLALKTFWVAKAAFTNPTNLKWTRWIRWISSSVGVAVIIFDFAFTVALTELVMDWWILFQSSGVSITNLEKLTAFESINFEAGETIKRSFYFLNGTVLMYFALLLSAITRGVVPRLTIRGVTKNLFKIVAILGILVVLVVSVARNTSH